MTHVRERRGLGAQRLSLFFEDHLERVRFAREMWRARVDSFSRLETRFEKEATCRRARQPREASLAPRLFDSLVWCRESGVRLVSGLFSIHLRVFWEAYFRPVLECTLELVRSSQIGPETSEMTSPQ